MIACHLADDMGKIERVGILGWAAYGVDWCALAIRVRNSYCTGERVHLVYNQISFADTLIANLL